jgi:2-dehydro-3-deoxygalactonokinase
MNEFISVDWGTTSLRASLCSSGGKIMLRSVSSDDGALSVHQRFLRESDKGPDARKAFYLKILQDLIHQLSLPADQKMPILISGMASSTIGMETIPYASLPFGLTGNNAVVKQWEADGQEYFMVSGLATEDDLMRGEETQLVGAAVLINMQHEEEALFIFPGTHAKHVQVKEGVVAGFKTYMTGEVFCQLFSNSILAQSVTPHHDHEGSSKEAFIKGVKEGSDGNILHQMFKVRTNGMFSRMGKQENFSYLSGMLIGAELKDLLLLQKNRIVLCGSGEMMQAYELALHSLNISAMLMTIDASLATAVGQHEICQPFSSRI